MTTAASHLRVVHDIDAPSDSKPPPHDVDAEAAVLGAVFIDPPAIARIRDFLRPEHFYSEAHRWIFEACVAIDGASTPIDLVTVGAWLRDRDRISQVGGMGGLTELLNAAPVTANVVPYATIVHDKWRVRQAIAACQRIAAHGYVDYGDSAQTFTDRAVRALAAIAQQGVGGASESNPDALRRILEGLAAQARDRSEGRERVTGIPTGLPAYDALTQGLHAGEKTTIAALPGRGKTALALQIAAWVAQRGIGVLYFSQEMRRDELFVRLLSLVGQVDGRRIKAATLSPAEWTRVYEAAARIEKLPLAIDDTPDLHIGQVRAKTVAHVERARMTRDAPVGLVVLDYVQRLKAQPEHERLKAHERVAHATKGFKLLCQELGIAGLELAQQKPCEVDPKTKLRPKPSTGCIADSSQIEKEADNVLFLHRKPLTDLSGKVKGEDPSSVVLILDKQRGGDTGSVDLTFAREFCRFDCARPELFGR